MIGLRSRMTIGTVLFLLAVGLSFPLLTSAQEKADTQKVYADVAGTYEFTYEGQSLVITFLVRDGLLYGKEEGSSEEAEIKPVDLDKLKFETTVQSTGQYYEIGFIRDEEGKVNKCHLSSGGVELDGVRVK